MGKIYVILLIIPVFLISIVGIKLTDIDLTFILTYLYLYFLIYIISFNFVHRSITHNQFKLTRLGKLLLSVVVLFNMKGDVLSICLMHRYHHRYSDTVKDIYSPSNGIWNSLFGWMYKSNTILNYLNLISDMSRDKDYKFLYFLHKFNIWIVLITLCLLYFISTKFLIILCCSMSTAFIIEILATTFFEHKKNFKTAFNNYVWSWFTLTPYHLFHHQHPSKISNYDPIKFLLPLFRLLFIVK